MTIAKDHCTPFRFAPSSRDGRAYGTLFLIPSLLDLDGKDGPLIMTISGILSLGHE
jgi:hypothetical protein